MALGAGCSLVFFLMSYVVGFVEISGLEDDAVTPIVQVGVITEVTATAPQQAIVVTATPETETTATSEATSEPTAEDVAAADIPTLTPTATLLGSGNNGSPTVAPQNGAGGAESASAAANNDIGTPVPTGGSPTETPSIGSNADIPTELLTIASPLVNIDGGTFTMGTTREEGLRAVDECVNRDGGNCTETLIQDATPAHQVTLDPFQFEIYEVSVNQYVAFLNNLSAAAPGVRADLIGCGGQPCILVQSEEPNSIVRYNQELMQYEIVNPEFHNNHPVTFVTWYGADAYCKSIGRRLPTEAEWERAARGPANSIYPWGPEWVPANANTSRSGTNGQGTQSVDAYPAGVNAYGIYNLAGNVSEWVFDFYLDNYYGTPAATQPNPQGPPTGELKVARGGGWDNVPLFARTVHRLDVDPKQPRASLGFRCAADAP